MEVGRGGRGGGGDGELGRRRGRRCAFQRLRPPSPGSAPEEPTPLTWVSAGRAAAAPSWGSVIGHGPRARPFCRSLTGHNAAAFEEASKCLPGRPPNHLRTRTGDGSAGPPPPSFPGGGQESAHQSPGKEDLGADHRS